MQRRLGSRRDLFCPLTGTVGVWRRVVGDGRMLRDQLAVFPYVCMCGVTCDR